LAQARELRAAEERARHGCGGKRGSLLLRPVKRVAGEGQPLRGAPDSRLVYEGRRTKRRGGGGGGGLKD